MIPNEQIREFFTELKEGETLYIPVEKQEYNAQQTRIARLIQKMQKEGIPNSRYFSCFKEVNQKGIFVSLRHSKHQIQGIIVSDSGETREIEDKSTWTQEDFNLAEWVKNLPENAGLDQNSLRRRIKEVIGK